LPARHGSAQPAAALASLPLATRNRFARVPRSLPEGLAGKARLARDLGSELRGAWT